MLMREFAPKMTRGTWGEIYNFTRISTEECEIVDVPCENKPYCRELSPLAIYSDQ